MAWDVMDFHRRLAAAVDAFDRPAAARLCAELVEQVSASDEVYEERAAKKVLECLRRKCYFDLMERVADAFLSAGQTAFQIRRQYAQALIDQGRLTAAIAVLADLVADTAADRRENAEARGLLGRIAKQRYVDADDPPVQRGRRWLQQAIAAYYTVYREDPENLWHGINSVALLARARRDRVAIAGFPPYRDLARQVLARIETASGRGEALAAWDLATAAEACVALGRSAAAQGWLVQYVNSPGTDAFELSSTLRQLVEVWRLDDGTEPGASLLPVLRSQLLARQGGGVSIAPVRLGEARAAAAAGPRLEKILGNDGMKTLRWYRNGLDRCLAVARIESPSEPFGTGFLVRGDLFHPSLGAERLLLTNAHVVSDDPQVTTALRHDEAVVRFEALAPDRTYRAAAILWSSPPGELDSTLLRLDAQPPEIEAYPLAPRLPLPDGQQRVYIIGHPGGRQLSISLHDNLLLDWEDPRLHYRTPTEGGSSGSPVFNGDWSLIGLHHAGDLNMRRLHGKPGTYAANEGIWIRTIVQRFQQEYAAR